MLQLLVKLHHEPPPIIILIIFIQVRCMKEDEGVSVSACGVNDSLPASVYLLATSVLSP